MCHLIYISVCCSYFLNPNPYVFLRNIITGDSVLGNFSEQKTFLDPSILKMIIPNIVCDTIGSTGNTFVKSRRHGASNGKKRPWINRWRNNVIGSCSFILLLLLFCFCFFRFDSNVRQCAMENAYRAAFADRNGEAAFGTLIHAHTHTLCVYVRIL